MSPLNYDETIDMPVGASIEIVGADGIMFTGGSSADMPLADALKRPNACRGTLRRTATSVQLENGNGGVMPFDIDDSGDNGWTSVEALHIGRIVVGSDTAGCDPEPAGLPAVLLFLAMRRR